MRLFIFLTLCGCTYFANAQEFVKSDVQKALKTMVEYQEQGHYETSIKVGEQWMQQLDGNVQFLRELLLVYNELAASYLQLNDFRVAEKYLKQAKDILPSIEKAPGILRAKLVTNEGNLHLKQSAYQKAFLLYEEALTLRKKHLGINHLETANAFNNLGLVHYLFGNLEVAEDFLRNALKIRVNLLGKETPELLSTYINLGAVSLKREATNQAASYYQKAFTIVSKKLDQSSLPNGRIHFGLGNVSFQKEDYESALERYILALNIYQQYLPKGHTDLGELYNSIGNCHQKLGSFNDAKQFFESALKTFQPEEEHLKLSASVNNNLGSLYFDLGSYAEAKLYFQKALDRLESLNLPNDLDYASIKNHLGICERWLGSRASVYHLFEALALKQSLVGENQPALWDNYHSIGNFYLESKYPDEALTYFSKAAKLSNTAIKKAKTLHNIGLCYYEKAEFKKALPYFLQAKTAIIQQFSSNHPIAGTYDENIVKSYMKLGRTNSAMEVLENALSLLRPQPQESYQASLFPKSLLTLLVLKQNLLLGKYKSTCKDSFLKDSRKSTQLAVTLLDSLPLEGQSNTFNQELIQSNYKVFENGIQTLYLLWQVTNEAHYIKEAFLLAEKSKSIKLLESLKKTRANSFGGVPDSIVHKEQRLSEDIAFLERKRELYFQSGVSTSGQTPFDSRVLRLKEAYMTLINTIEATYPKYFKLKHDRNLVSVDQIQTELLAPNQALLEYFVGENYIYAFTIVANQIHLQEIELDFSLERKILDIRKGIKNYLFVDWNSAQFFNKIYCEESWKIYQRLFLPIYQQLPSDVKRVAIIPDGSLHYLPFDALLTESPGQVYKFSNLPYLIQEFAISYLYSASFWQEIQLDHPINAPSPNNSFIAFAPSYQDGSKDLPSLKYNRLEAQVFSKFFKGTALLDSSATLKNFLRLAPDHRIIHLATHGKANFEIGAASNLAFYQSSTDPEQNHLYVDQLYGLRLNADLVVLSACESGIGEYEQGEGVVGLARGFTYAGAKSVISTLWTVNDSKAYQLVNTFYAHLKEGMEIDLALQKAKIEFINSHPHDEAHPYYWSAYVQVGKTEAIWNSGWLNGFVWWIVVVGIVAVVFWIGNRVSVLKVRRFYQ